MRPIKLSYFSYLDKNILTEQFQRLQQQWPEYIQHSQAAQKYLGLRFNVFADYFFHGTDTTLNETFSYASAFPIYIDPINSAYPPTWDSALEQCWEMHSKKIVPNALVVFDIVVLAAAQSQGLANELLQYVLRMAQQNHFSFVLVYVRPVLPLSAHFSEEQVLQDPWVQHHLRVGASPLGLSRESMAISGTKTEWEAWTQLELNKSGDYPLPMGVVPLNYDHQNQWGTYLEPNYIVLHGLPHE